MMITIASKVFTAPGDTLYTSWGDWFGWTLVGMMHILVVFAPWRKVFIMFVTNHNRPAFSGRFSFYLLHFFDRLAQHSLHFLRYDTPRVTKVDLMMFAIFNKSIIWNEIAVHLVQNGSLIIV